MAYNAPDNDPFNALEPNYAPETLTLDGIISAHAHTQALAMRVCVPVRVIAVYGNQTVDLQPLLKARYLQGTVVIMPPLLRVPVIMPMGADYLMRLPVAVGDLGAALFADRSLDNWLASATGDAVDTEDDRCHDLADGMFIPGLYPTAMQSKDTTTDLIIRNGSLTTRLLKNGKVAISNDTNELLSVVDQLVANLSALMDVLQTQFFTLTMLGPQPPIAASIAAVKQVQAVTTQIKQKLGTLKV